MPLHRVAQGPDSPVVTGLDLQNNIACPHPHILFRNAIEGRLYSCPHLLSYFTFNVAVVLCVRVPEVPVNVSVDVPLEAPFGTAKSIVVLAVSDPDVSVTDEGTIVHVELSGPPLQVKPIVPVKPVFEDSVRVEIDPVVTNRAESQAVIETPRAIKLFNVQL